MLKTRVLTALILLAGFAPALFFFPQIAWAWLAALLAAPVAWEWGGLLRLQRGWRLGVAFLAFCLAALAIVFVPAALGIDGFDVSTAWSFGRWFYFPAAIFWGLLLPFWLHERWSLANPALGLAVGAVVLFPSLLAFVQLRMLGPLSLFAILAIAWVADIAAYFAGRRFGRRKLAPSISPGKTWAGVVGAVAGVLLYGFVVTPWLPAVLRPSIPVLAVVLVVLTTLGIVGDLLESLLKRQAGLKDSSDLLPGHGGILDRIDSQTSTLPVVALLWLACA